MNMCSHRHDEVVFEGNQCPVCAAKEEISSLESRVEDLRQTVADLRTREEARE